MKFCQTTDTLDCKLDFIVSKFVKSWTGPKFQAKNSGFSGVCLQVKGGGGGWVVMPPSKDEGQRDIGHNMSITRYKKIYFWESEMVMIWYLVHYDTFLQNETNIITKRNKKL